jgi:hypothetical protein
MSDPFDPFLNLTTTLEVCPLCGEENQEVKARFLENDPEWEYEFDCPVTGQSFKARTVRQPEPEGQPCPER